LLLSFVNDRISVISTSWIMWLSQQTAHYNAEWNHIAMQQDIGLTASESQSQYTPYTERRSDI